MAFKLSKSESAKRDELIGWMRDKLTELKAEVSDFNGKLDELKEPLQHAIDGYNEAVEAARAYCEEIAEERQGNFDDKSEKWQEGEKGEAAQEWLNEWQNIDLSEIVIELPDELEAPEASHADDLEALPANAEED